MKCVLVLLGSVLLVALAACGSEIAGIPIKARYVDENEGLLASLPLPEGAQLVRLASSPYYEGDSGFEPPAGYTTNAVYRVPAGTTDQEIIDFYVQRLRDEWEYCLEGVGVIAVVPRGVPTPTPMGYIKLAHLERGQAFVSVNTDGLFEATHSGTFEIGVDHKGARDTCDRLRESQTGGTD